MYTNICTYTYVFTYPYHCRPVPLQHFVFPAAAEGLFLVVDDKGRFKEDNFQKAMSSLQVVRHIVIYYDVMYNIYACLCRCMKLVCVYMCKNCILYIVYYIYEMNILYFISHTISYSILYYTIPQMPSDLDSGDKKKGGRKKVTNTIQTDLVRIVRLV